MALAAQRHAAARATAQELRSTALPRRICGYDARALQPPNVCRRLQVIVDTQLRRRVRVAAVLH